MSEAVLYVRGFASQLTDTVRVLCEGSVSAAFGGTAQGRWAAMALRPTLGAAIASSTAALLGRPVVLVMTRGRRLTVALHQPDGLMIGPVDGHDPRAVDALADALRAVRGVRWIDSAALRKLVGEQGTASKSDRRAQQLAADLGFVPKRRSSSQTGGPLQQKGLRPRIGQLAVLTAKYRRLRRLRRLRAVVDTVGLLAALIAVVGIGKDNNVGLTTFAALAAVAFVARIGLSRSMRGVPAG